MPYAFARHVAIVGGGRWSRVAAGVLCEIAPSQTRLTLCSPSHPESWEAWKLESGKVGTRDVRVERDLDQLLSDTSVDFVAVIRAARDNAATTIKALEAGKMVLVEKPFAMDLAQAQQVLAAARGRICATGLVFLFAPNLRLFASSLGEIGPLEKIDIRWHDPQGEKRHAEMKSYDSSLNCLLDVLPHIWSLLRLLSPDAKLRAKDAKAAAGGRNVQIGLQLGESQVHIDIARNSDMRRRMMHIRGKGGEASIDFSTEPGTASINGRILDIATDFASPLAIELGAVAHGLTGPYAEPLCRVERAIESIALAEDLMPSIRRDQWNQIEAGLLSRATEPEREAADYALTEIVVDKLLNKHGSSQDLRPPAQWRAGIHGIVRDWLTGKEQDGAVPVGIRTDAEFGALRRRLADAR